jgi:transcriptional regulator GlxA family with amidase domain
MPNSAPNEGLRKSFRNIAFAFAFGNVSRFKRVFRRRFAYTPSGAAWA